MLDQMMILAADMSTKNYQLLDAVSQNIGNANVYGYKTMRFEQFMRPDGNVDQIKRVDFSQGDIFMTKRELDVALAEPGFIQVTRKDGSVAYTRNGSFARNAEGQIITPFGDLVAPGVNLPAEYKKLSIEKDGSIMVTRKAGDQPEKLGQLTVVNFNNPEGLKTLGNNLWGKTKDSGDAQPVKNHQMVRQGFLEQSNLNLHYAVEDILRLNAGVISNLRVVKAVDDIYKEAVNLRQ